MRRTKTKDPVSYLVRLVNHLDTLEGVGHHCVWQIRGRKSMPAFLSLWAMCALALPRWQAHTVWPHVASRASGLIDRVRVRLMLFSPAITGTSNERHISSKFLDSEKGSARHGVMNGDLRSFPGLLVCINVALFTAKRRGNGSGILSRSVSEVSLQVCQHLIGKGWRWRDIKRTF